MWCMWLSRLGSFSIFAAIFTTPVGGVVVIVVAFEAGVPIRNPVVGYCFFPGSDG